MRYTYDEIIGSKNFYRDNYRRLITVLLVSLVINVVLIALVFYFKLTQPPARFYASNAYGITKLDGLNTANYSDKPLLKPDPDEESMEKQLLID